MAKEPAWLLAARAKLGTREAAGPANSPTILGWAKRLGTKVLGIVYNADSVPWCGLFVGYCIDEPTHRRALLPEQVAQHPAARERVEQMQFVDPTHDRQIAVRH